MLTLAPGYARLDIARDEEFAEVAESVRSLLHVCHLNGLAAALVVSAQDAFDWRSSLRIGIRFAVSRSALRGMRIALVVDHFNEGAQRDVLAVTAEAGLECRIFRGEAEAAGWLTLGAVAPGRASPRR